MLHPRVARVAVAIAVSMVLLLVAVQPAVARHCSSYSTSTTSDAQVVHSADGVYVAVDTCLEACGVWVYEETNGIPGLQRGDENRDDTCHGLATADTRTL